MDVRILKVSLVLMGLALSSCGQPAKFANATESLKSASCVSATAITSEVIVEWESGEITLEKVNDIEKFKEEFVRPQIQYIKQVQYNQMVKTHDSEVSENAFFGNDNNWGQGSTQVQQLWDKGIYGKDVLIGVVDAFVDDTHPQLSKRIAYNFSDSTMDGKDNDNNGEVDDFRGLDITNDGYVKDTQGNVVQLPNAHGTHVSGVIAGEHGTNGVKGIAPQAKIIIGSFLDHKGSGNLEGALRAVQYVAGRGAKVINASWGVADCAPILASVVAKLDQKGIMFIAASGNNGQNLDYNYNVPSSFRLPRQINVGAHSIDNFMTGFSNFSETIVHLTAPGEMIYSTVPGNSWGNMTGTSMAAPFVTGITALLRGAFPSADSLQIKKAILESVDVIPNKESRTITRGQINAAKAYDRLKLIVNQ